MYCNVFKRYELKFMLNTEQYEELRTLLAEYMHADEYGESDILNIYYDTPDFRLIRRSLEKPVYKEKLRVRSYGIPAKDDDVFVEIKKKYDSIVYKRRICEKLKDVPALFDGSIDSSQIGREIDYFIKLYQGIEPKMFISYNREAFYSKTDDDFRLTLDRNILWRDYDLSLDLGIYGNRVIGCDQVLMEVKTAAAIPIWLTEFLTKHRIYKTTFSKYGAAYIQYLENNIQGGQKIA